MPLPSRQATTTPNLMHPPLTGFCDYRVFLRATFENLRRARPRTTRASFARRLGLAPHRLGEIFSGKEGLSRARAKDVGSRLGLPADDLEDFCDLVSAQHDRTLHARNDAKMRVDRRRAMPAHRAMEVDDFAPLSDWHFFAILTVLHGRRLRSATIAERLSLPKLRVVDALRKLKRLRIVDRDGRPAEWRVVGAPIEVQRGFNAESVQRFHRQTLERAAQSLARTPPEDREFVTLFVRASKTSIPLVRERIRKYWRAMECELEKDSYAEEVYALAVQYFPLGR